MTISRAAGVPAVALGTLLLVLLAAAPAAAGALTDPADQDALVQAKALYTAAAYDEALAILSQLDGDKSPGSIEAKQYRAFCLLALGRADDAKNVIQQIVEANPSFQPSEAQVSPRLLDAFRDVRRKVLPAIVRQSYAEAKTAFERKDFEVAGRGFTGVIALLDDGDTKGAGDLQDLRILSNGFLELIATLPKAESRPAAEANPPPAVTIPAVPAPDPVTIFDVGNADVLPPVAISQTVPPWHPAKRDAEASDGTMILVVDEHGDVRSISMQGIADPAYAALLRRAAARWKYQPATRNGVPVKYRRLVAIHLNPVDPNRPSR
jgi:tetratricopeptide (TPR) repeat protein